MADAVLGLHVAVILFNIFGLIAIPLGARRRWRFVRIYWWRALHLASLGVVALQAVLGRACFLTLWQDALTQQAGQTAVKTPLIQGLVMKMIYWPVPFWVFTLLYAALWILVLFLWWCVPPRRATNL